MSAAAAGAGLEGRPDATDAPAILEARNVSAGYGSVPVLHDISLRVGAGEIVVLLGPNGAGKTTLLLALSGSLPAVTGEVRLHGRPTRQPLYRRARSGMALVTDDRSIFPSLTAAENLRVGSVDTEVALQLFPELSTRMDVVAGLLSGGEQQMLTLARALSRKPKVLLIDELSLGLAPMIVQRLLERVAQAARDTGTAVLLVEQHVRKALQFADSGYILNRGRIQLQGSGAELRERIGEIETSYLAGVPT